MSVLIFFDLGNNSFENSTAQHDRMENIFNPFRSSKKEPREQKVAKADLEVEEQPLTPSIKRVQNEPIPSFLEQKTQLGSHLTSSAENFSNIQNTPQVPQENKSDEFQNNATHNDLKYGQLNHHSTNETPHNFYETSNSSETNQKESKQKLPSATTMTSNGRAMQNEQFTINPFKQEINQNNNNINDNHYHQNATSYPIIAPTISVLPNSNVNERTESSNIRHGELFMLNGNRPIVFDWTTLKSDTSDFATRSALLTYFNSANFSIKISRICDSVDNNKKTYKVKLYIVMSQTNFCLTSFKQKKALELLIVEDGKTYLLLTRYSELEDLNNKVFNLQFFFYIFFGHFFLHFLDTFFPVTPKISDTQISSIS